MSSATGVDVFAALASPVRRDLIRLLRDGGPQSVQDLAASFDMRRPSVSEHLKVLRDAGLVTERRSGRKRLYRLEPEPLMDLRDWLTPYERFWRERMSDFAALVAEESATEGNPV
ncbi:MULTISPECIES: helix-turn-helix transcriptional regulator [Micromonospora]|uniref:ArsR/SmtB family transcription factor n=1 Tax=Micromonospora TaxID=1873 RepID=UPI000D14B673|nr:metalloregulator ArsR/SmtB family transcription factor [Micromonospora sp. MH33]PSK64507.1 HTH-type transcriptional regulator [Micromonospora sp. MH33]